MARKRNGIRYSLNNNSEEKLSMITTLYRAFSIALVFSLMALLSGCAEVVNRQSDTSNVLNQAAEQYVKLGLELGEYDKDYVDAYLGPDNQKVLYERDVLFPIAGLDPATAEVLDQLNELTSQLSHSTTATAQLYLNGEISREEAIEQRRKYALVSQEKAEQSVRFIEQYRAYVLNYNVGKDIVSAYINKQSQHQAGKWQAFERMLIELSTASDMLK